MYHTDIEIVGSNFGRHVHYAGGIYDSYLLVPVIPYPDKPELKIEDGLALIYKF